VFYLPVQTLVEVVNAVALAEGWVFIEEDLF
jgi:hypothetical protein